MRHSERIRAWCNPHALCTLTKKGFCRDDSHLASLKAPPSYGGPLAELKADMETLQKQFELLTVETITSAFGSQSVLCDRSDNRQGRLSPL